jgi:hypothetical protein
LYITHLFVQETILGQWISYVLSLALLIDTIFLKSISHWVVILLSIFNVIFQLMLFVNHNYYYYYSCIVFLIFHEFYFHFIFHFHKSSYLLLFMYCVMSITLFLEWRWNLYVIALWNKILSLQILCNLVQTHLAYLMLPFY